MNAKLAAITSQATIDLDAFIREGEQKILEAWTACAEEAQDQETKPKFKLAFSIILDLDADKMETALSWSIRHKLSRDAAIPNPDQMTFTETFASNLQSKGIDAKVSIP